MDADTARSSIQARTDRRDGRWSPQCFQRSVSVERPQARDAVGDSMHSTSARPAWAGDARSPADGRGAKDEDQSPLLRDQIRLCAPSSPWTRRAWMVAGNDGSSSVTDR